MMQPLSASPDIAFATDDDGGLLLQLPSDPRAVVVRSPRRFPLRSLVQAWVPLAVVAASRVYLVAATTLALLGCMALALDVTADSFARVATRLGVVCLPLVAGISCRKLWLSASLRWALYSVKPLPPFPLPGGLPSSEARLGYGAAMGSITVQAFALSMGTLFFGAALLLLTGEAVRTTGWQTVVVVRAASGALLLASSLLTFLCCKCGVLASFRDGEAAWGFTLDVLMWVALFLNLLLRAPSIGL